MSVLVSSACTAPASHLPSALLPCYYQTSHPGTFTGREGDMKDTTAAFQYKSVTPFSFFLTCCCLLFQLAVSHTPSLPLLRLVGVTHKQCIIDSTVDTQLRMDLSSKRGCWDDEYGPQKLLTHLKLFSLLSAKFCIIKIK